MTKPVTVAAMSLVDEGNWHCVTSRSRVGHGLYKVAVLVCLLRWMVHHPREQAFDPDLLTPHQRLAYGFSVSG